MCASAFPLGGAVVQVGGVAVTGSLDTPNRSWLLRHLDPCRSRSGAGFAGRLMDEIGAAGVVMMRQGGAALVLLVVTRPALRGRSRAQWHTIAAFGMILATMNLTFYAAVERLPLGIAVTIELLGPLGLAAVLSRRAAEFACVGVALAGCGAAGRGRRCARPGGHRLRARRRRVLGCLHPGEPARPGSSRAADALALAMTLAALLVAPLGMQAGAALMGRHTLVDGGHGGRAGRAHPVLRRARGLAVGAATRVRRADEPQPGGGHAEWLRMLDEHLTALQFVAMATVVAASIATVRLSQPP